MRTGSLVIIFSLFFISFDGIGDDKKTEFEKWQQQRNLQFNAYVSDRDKAFADFLKQKWIKKTVQQQQKSLSEPKLPSAPVAPKKVPAPVSHKETPIVDLKPLSRTPHLEMVEPEQTIAVDSQNIFFLGHQLTVPKVTIEPLNLEQLSSPVISDSWLVMSKNENTELAKSIGQIAKKLNLDSWGKAYLTFEIIKQSSVQNQNEQLLYTWFYLVKQNLNSRIAFDKNHLYLLLNIEQNLFGQKYFTFNKMKYYFVNFSDKKVLPAKQVFTYQKQHEQSRNLIQINLAKIPNLPNTNKVRRLSYKYAGKQQVVNVKYNRHYIDYLNLYPQLDVAKYFHSELSPITKESLLTPLREQLKGKSEQQALNMLLRFVQKAFDYQTDQQQFNGENFLVATETLHYPYADCEDRSVLFHYLVKQLLGNKMIAVLYQGHIATAVKLNTSMEGDSYQVDGEKYLVADPTYIGADIGEVMPGYEKQTPKLIRL